jgi:uncharacterized protein YukE
MAKVQMSETELRDLSSLVKRQQGNVEAVVSAGNRAVGVASSEWKSTAFDSFNTLWQQNRHILEQLAEDLKAWSPKLNSHGDVAQFTNRPFKH